MKSLPEARKHADDLLVYDNTPDGKGHWLVARFMSGELVRVTRSSRDWLKRLFSRELRGQMSTSFALFCGFPSSPSPHHTYSRLLCVLNPKFFGNFYGRRTNRAC